MNQLTVTQKLGAILLAILIAIVGLESVLWDHDPALQNLDNIFALPSIADPLGTDQFGRSNLARLSSALQTSLFMVLLCVLTSAYLG
ncbi:dipeptide transport system permease protein dppC [Vibrio ishigakensis]|uniref:Dipeptide transport system permease protein dppC n=1 Tax=Vibrio ishigakensis TaxID=1481914 RepID=A0A0B8QVC6_9VIBR|nr:dipeptide transport system permease protein dppC [Vibrio ishigakensis]